MTAADCPFCRPDAERVFHAGERVLALWDGYPVSPGHALVITRRHVPTLFDASAEERSEMMEAVDAVRRRIEREWHPDGFTVGINVGEAAGQTVFHLHVHVIPRYRGDVADPRGGVRHVIPGHGHYRVETGGTPTVRDGEAPWNRRSPSGAATADRDPGEAALAADGADAAAGAAAFGEKLLQLLDEGRFTATYKYAVLLALVDLCSERDPRQPGPAAFTARQLAEKVVELYWPQTAPYEGRSGAVTLSQNRGGQAEIVAAIRNFRERSGADPSEPLSRARHRAPQRYARLVATIGWKLIEMPLPRLQVVGDAESRFLYRINWNAGLRRSDTREPGFDDRIHLAEGAAEHIVRLSGLLRPLIQRAWAAMIAGMNGDATDEARLQEFLFGARRVALEPIRADLRDLQDNRCFYCDRRMDGAAAVDHFIPWARYPDNGIDNLVVADPRCNGHKRDFLAAGGHLGRWAARFRSGQDAATRHLTAIAARAKWDHHPERTLNAARAIYLRLPADVRLWHRAREFVRAGEQQHAIAAALECSLRA